jgi:hypothetical protein
MSHPWSLVRAVSCSLATFVFGPLLGCISPFMVCWLSSVDKYHLTTARDLHVSKVGALPGP